jgi:hypothetical protein
VADKESIHLGKLTWELIQIRESKSNGKLIVDALKTSKNRMGKSTIEHTFVEE